MLNIVYTPSAFCTNISLLDNTNSLNPYSKSTSNNNTNTDVLTMILNLPSIYYIIGIIIIIFIFGTILILL